MVSSLTALTYIASSFSLRFMPCVTACYAAGPWFWYPLVFFYVILATAVFQILQIVVYHLKCLFEVREHLITRPGAEMQRLEDSSRAV